MTRVQGDLKIITGTAEAATEVRVRSKVSRPVPGGWLMDMSDRRPVFDGKVDLELLPGACVLVAISGGLPSEAVDLIVPESGTATLESCIRAAEAAGDLERDALDELRRDFGAWIDEARASVGAADGSAKAAKAEADKAKGSADAAGKSATSADSSASAAKTSADSAGKSATAAASSASAAKADAGKAATSATEASNSAKSAKADADRAEGVVDSVDWHNDRLLVMGKASPPLTGPRGEKGEPGTSGASTWEAIAGKPTKFPPESHKHKMADISDLPQVSPYGDPNTIMQRSSSGHAILNANATPTSIAHVTHKKYVDDRDAATLAEAKALVESRATVKQVTSPPATFEPGVLYVIPE
ncbi:hypothetical protein [Corynebacterium macclintockiae]|uniref:hypothetical protein n=1 Tax=Corynebacterium macclintockiae TaxID=2913501 RepID=UPI003EB6B1CA